MMQPNQTPSSPPPLAYERPQAGIIPGVFRDGNLLVVPHHADISGYCLHCGRPAHGAPIRKIVASPDGNAGSGTSSSGGRSMGDELAVAFLAVVAFFALIFLVPNLFKKATPAEKRVVKYGLCEAHMRKRVNTKRTAWIIFGAAVATMVLGAFVLSHHTGRIGAFLGFLAAMTALGGPIMILVAMVLLSTIRSVSVTRENLEYMWVSGAGETLVNAQSEIP